MKCVRCKQDLTQEWYEEVEIDRCGKCHGAWLDAGELAKIVASPTETFCETLIAKTLESRSKGVPKAEIESIDPCPKCSVEMKPINYAYGSGVVFDSCPKGHGIWLDAKELEKVQIFKEHGDKELEENYDKWHQIAKDAKKKVKNELGSDGGSSLLSRLARFTRDWLNVD